MATTRRHRIDGGQIELKIFNNDSVAITNHKTGDSFAYEQKDDGSHIDNIISDYQKMMDKEVAEGEQKFIDFLESGGEISEEEPI